MYVDKSFHPLLYLGFTTDCGLDYPAVYSANISAVNISCSAPGCMRPLIFASTVPIIDSSGAEAPGDPGPWKAISSNVFQPLGNYTMAGVLRNHF